MKRILTAVLIAAPVLLQAQFPPGPPQPPGPPKQSAPFDLTGYWVSIVTEDWRFRMFTPPKGDLNGIPLNAEGRKIANAWDPDKDTAEGLQCKSYGMPAIMRVPGRFHITWENDSVLKIDTDAGTQTRRLVFGGTQPASVALSWQGYSSAQWERQLGRNRGGQGQPGAGDSRGGDLKVVTTGLRSGYLRKNGPPYSEKTTVTEYVDLLREADGSQWVIWKTIVEDPVYLAQPFITSTNLRKQADASGWDPSPCVAR